MRFWGFFFSLLFWLASDCIVNKKPLGGLLILLPRSGDGGEAGDGDGASLIGVLRGVLMEVEQLFVHANLPVSMVSNVGDFADFDCSIVWCGVCCSQTILFRCLMRI